MPSVLDLFGELDLRNDSFNRKLRGSVEQMQSADAQLNKVISSSNKLGDTSATVARRYEKLNDGIALQKTRLIEATQAYQAGDINAKKYAATLASVETQTRNLASRIADAKARVQELNETNLTHFQQQIDGAVSKSNSLFGNLSRFQKTQLSFQLNDIISGLLSGQSPMQILAQQGGQVVQIFQMGKQSAVETAVAANAAAVAETRFAESAQVAAVAQGEVAVASKATAAATTEASGAMTVFGVSIVSAGAALAAGLVSILAAKKASEDVLKTAQDRLKTEENIAGALNKQYQIAIDLKAALADISSKGQADRLLKGFDNSPAGIGSLQNYQAQLQAQLNANIQSLAIADRQKTAEADRLGLTGKVREQALLSDPAIKAANEKLAEQIKAAATQIEVLKNSQQTSTEWYGDALKRQVDFLNQSNNDQVKAQEKAARAAEEFARKLDSAIQKVQQRIDTAYSDTLKTPARLEDAYTLSRKAQEFRQGFKFEAQSASQTLQGQLEALLPTSVVNQIVGTVSGGSLPESTITRAIKSFQMPKLNADQQHALDQEIIKLTQGLNPADLTQGQRDVAAGAFQREAERDKSEIKKAFEDLKKAIKEEGILLTIKNQAPESAQVTKNPSLADVNNRYGN